MADIFISYASEDRERARKLAVALEAQGWSVWWDRTMLPGTEFDQVIEQELDASSSVVVLWSEISVASRWVKAEAREGLDQNKLVPVFLGNTRVPLVFRGVQGADLAGWLGEPESPAFRQLVEAVSNKIGHPPIGKIEGNSHGDRNTTQRERVDAPLASHHTRDEEAVEEQLTEGLEYRRGNPAVLLVFVTAIFIIWLLFWALPSYIR